MKSLTFTLLLYLAIGIQASSAQYQATDIPKNKETTTNGLPPAAELEPFLDGLIQGLLKSHHLAGATVSIVNGDSIVFAKGYGHANLEERKPVDADSTLFRIASISKLFVWTAVMQLAEQDKLDLDADINQYLGDFQIPTTFKEPITLKNLMTHTPGFEEWVIHLIAQDTTELIPLEEAVKKYRPERVRPPGHITAYSNYGTGLAAYIVQQVSGQPFEAYVKEHIREPLQMDRTTYQQPLPNGLRDDLARGYQYQNGIFKEMPDRYFIMAPMGGASSTATDMARLMMAFLNEGHYNNTSILDSTSVRTMLSPLYEPAPGVSPMAYGFMAERYAGNDAIGHGGAIWEYYSLLLMLPKKNVGFFIAFNSDNGRAALADFAEAFFGRYFNKDIDNSITTPATNVSPDSLSRFEGVYQRARRSYSTLAKIAALQLSVDVSITQDSLLKTEGQETTLWAATDHPLSFREKGGRGILSFKVGADGNPAYLYFGNVPYMAYERAGFWNLPVVNDLILLFAGLLFLGTIIFWPAAAHIRRQSTVNNANLLPKGAYWTGWANALVLLTFIIGLFILLSDSNDPIIYGIGTGLKFLLLIPFLGILLTAASLFLTAQIWIAGKGTLLRRIFYTLLTSVFVIVLLLFHHWNLIGFHY